MDTDKGTKKDNSSFVVNYVKQHIPKYRYYNDAYIRGSLVNNSSFFNEVTKTISNKYLEGNKDFKEYYNQNPDEYKSKLDNYRAKFRKTLALETSYGETVKSSITNRHMKLNQGVSEDNVGNLGLFYRQVAEANSKDFKNTSLYGDEGFSFDDSAAGNVALVDHVNSSNELRNKIYSEKYNEFLTVLDNKNNQGVVNKGNVEDLVKAYVMYVENGSEGLTQFINYKQSFDEDINAEEQDDITKEALKYLDKVNFKESLAKFIGDEEDGFSIDPIRRSFDVKNRIPADRNKFTRNFYDSENQDEALDNIIGSYKSDQSWFDKLIEKAGLKLTPQEKNKPLSEWTYPFQIGSRSAGTVEDGEFNFTGLDKQIYNSSTEEIRQDIYDGNETIATNAIYKHVLNKAKIGEEYGMEDLIRTLAVNATSYRVNDDGIEEYVLDYNSMDAKTKLAFNALRMDDEGYASSIIEGNNGKIYFQPEFLEREVGRLRGNIQRQSIKKYYTEDGKIKYRESENVQDEPYGFLSGLGYGVGQFGYEIIGKDFVEKGLIPLIRKATGGDLTEFERNYRQTIKPMWDNEALAQSTESGAFGAGSTIGYLASYLTTAGKLGRSAVRNYFKGGKTLARLDNIKRYKDGQGYYVMNKLLGGRKSSDIIKKFDKLENKSKLMGAANIEVGNMILVTGDSDFSTIETLSAMDEGSSINQFYNTSGRAVQLALDIGTELAMTGLFDAIIAGSRSAGQFYKGKRLGKENPFNSGVFDENTNNFIYSNKHSFWDNSDLYRVYKNVFQGFQDTNLGELKTSINKLSNEPVHQLKVADTEGTLSDMVVRFKKNAEPFIKDVKGKIRDRVVDHDAKYSFGSSMSDQQVNDLTDELYDNYLDKTAKQLGDLFDSIADDAKFVGEYRSLREETGDVGASYIFGDMLQNMAPKTEQYITDDKTTFSYSEFLQIKQDNPTSIVKRVGIDEYEIWKTDEAFWGVDLGKRMKAQTVNKSKEGIIEDNKSMITHSFRGDAEESTRMITEEVEKATDIINENIGRVVPVDGKLGYITDYNHNKKQFTVLDESGKRHTITNPDEYTSGSLKNSEAAKQFMQDRKKTFEQYRQLAQESDVDQSARAWILSKEAEKSLDNEVSMYKKLIYKIEEAVDKVKKGIKNIDYISTAKNDPSLESVGLGSDMVSWIQKVSGYKQFRKGSARKVATLMGTDNNIGYKAFSKNQVIKALGDIPEKGIPTGTIFRQNIDGIDEYFITTKKLKKGDTVKPWIETSDGRRIVMNEKIRRINPNITFKKNGEPMLHKKVVIDGEGLYTPAEVGETGVIINVQRPVQRGKRKLSRKRILKEQFDAEEIVIDGKKHYRLINEGQQTIDPTKLKEKPSKIYNSKTTVERYC